MKANAIKVYDGPSLIDGKRIIVLVTGLSKSSSNTKTGDMLQTWILRYDVAPHDAVKTGDDSSVCGMCPLRPYLKNERPAHLPKPCYVKTFQAPRSTWKANRDLPVTPIDEASAMVAGRKVRRGSYGDPMAAPRWVWEAIKTTHNPTGYTHQWSTMVGDYSGLVMASVHTPKERQWAKSKGYRTFRVMASVSDLQSGEVLCPASKEAGNRTTCAKCSLCSGATVSDKRKDVAIVAH